MLFGYINNNTNKSLEVIDMAKKKNKISFTITMQDLDYNKLEGEELQRFLMERKRGCGKHKSKRDYTRKEKYKKDWR